MSEFGGDAPDTFDGRLAGVARLIDTFDDEVNVDRRRARRTAILILLDGLRDLALDQVDDLRERLPD